MNNLSKTDREIGALALCGWGERMRSCEDPVAQRDVILTALDEIGDAEISPELRDCLDDALRKSLRANTEPFLRSRGL